MAFQLIICALLLIVLAALYLINRKMCRVDRATWNLPIYLDSKINDAELRLYHQIEALTGLNALIHPNLPLPALRDWAGSPDFLLELARKVIAQKPTTIVECSCGASTLVSAHACRLVGSGHVYSLEHEPKFAQETRDRLKEAGLEQWASVIDAPLETLDLLGEEFPWYSLTSLPDLKIDMLVVDGPPAPLRPLARYPAGPKLLPRLAPGAVVLIDDASRPDEREIVKRWLLEFPELHLQTIPAEKGLVALSNAT